ncbi:hypothetical protein OEZ86_000809 [Tetradesmus obliquus]|nr:hypothetical protein OEZ86_000809 [Tetradesmus obliquus]
MVDESTYICPGSFAACCETAAAVLAVLDTVLDGSSPPAASGFPASSPAGFCLVRPPGHHVLPSRPMGFGLVNFMAVAARHAQQQQRVPVHKVLIMDFDVHHGNGTEEIMYSDPSVLYISTHQQGLWPYTGKVQQIGSGEGKGCTINIPLPGGAGHAAMQQVLQQVIQPAARSFQPDLILVSAGYDSHFMDPLAGFQFESKTYHMLCGALARLSHELCGGRCMFILEGGYHQQSLGEAAVDSFAGILGLPVLSSSGSNTALPEEPLDKVEKLLAQNIKSLASSGPSSPKVVLPGGFRTDNDWKKEVDDSRKSGEYRGQLSSRLREDNMQLQVAAELQVEAGVGRVEAALRGKLAQTQALAQGLEAALAAVNSEMAGLSRAQQRLTTMKEHLQAKVSVNKSRQQVRSDRPQRELVCDEVNRSLARQETLLCGLLERLGRAVALVAADSGKLAGIKQLLSRDLKDKVDVVQSALKVDEAVLSVKPGEASTAAAPTAVKVGTAMARAAAAGAARTAGSTYSHSWKQQTDMLLQEAQHTAADAARLRKAVKQLLQEAHAASQAAGQALNASLAAKLGSTKLLKDELAAQLSNVQDERARATQQRDSLRSSLQEKQVPLQQLEARYALRAARPDGEAVEDEVQYALAAEAAQLAAVSAQLSQRVGAADTQISRLDELSAALLQNIADKEAALSLEEKVALMDGRALPAVPPTPSVLSVCSSVASGYSGLGESASQVCSRVSTPMARRAGGAGGSRAGGGGSCAGTSVTSSAIARIAALEQELAAAKVETEQLQKTITAMKDKPATATGSRRGA